ncbi:hypothetical protein PoMZ_01043 [Pyricularia oryzae]|uniref:Uncharacterized protein n=1 Tax=Pyricularia oryzae TaxID=318829 RepID=A0A4P7N1A1_PYROR|nr:hypothetical protein PoMZ_01043 [Pyricularia oryzae]
MDLGSVGSQFTAVHGDHGEAQPSKQMQTAKVQILSIKHQASSISISSFGLGEFDNGQEKPKR